MAKLYYDMIQRYFKDKELSQDKYFDDKIQTIDVGKQRTDETFQMIKNAYRMHLFIVGPLSSTQFQTISDKLKRRFGKYTGTQEFMLAFNWPQYLTLQSAHANRDAFLCMIEELQHSVADYSYLPTAYEFCLTRKTMEDRSRLKSVTFDNAAAPHTDNTRRNREVPDPYDGEQRNTYTQ